MCVYLVVSLIHTCLSSSMTADSLSPITAKSNWSKHIYESVICTVDIQSVCIPTVLDFGWVDVVEVEMSLICL